MEKSCGNCVNCDKINKGKLGWICEEYGFYYNGFAPVNVTPPHDEACRFWTDDPKKKNTWVRYV
jgi:hypothetical protein